MKKRVALRLPALAALLLTGITVRGADNLIPNGNFEDLYKDGHPRGYSRAPEYGGATSSSSSFSATTNAYSGQSAGHYVCRNAGGFISYHGLRLKPKTWYRFSGMIATDVDQVMESAKTAVPPPGVFVKMMPELPGNWKGPWPKVTQPMLYAGGGFSDWKKYVQYFQSDSVWTNMWIGIYIMRVDGEARFDDLELVEATEAEATAHERSQAGFDVVETENVYFNGSFEIAANDDMPDYIFTGIGAPWFKDYWTMRRLGSADSPHGSHYLHAQGYLIGEKMRTDPKRESVLSFFARSDKPGVRISVAFNGSSQRFALTEKWTRYSMPCKAGAGGQVGFHAVKSGDEFDLDAIMVNYGKTVAPYRPHRDDGFFDSFRAAQDQKGARRNAAFSNVVFTGPAAAAAPVRDGKVDFRFDTVFQGDGLAVRGLIPDSSRELTILDAAGKAVRRIRVSAAELEKGVAIAKDLPLGADYSLAGNPIAFRVVPPPADGRWCRVDRFAHMAFTEKGPYFPCAFSLSMSEKFIHRIPEIGEVGFNTAIVWGYGVSKDESEYKNFDAARVRPVLDKLGESGINVISFTPVMPEERLLALRKDKSIPRVFAWDIMRTDFKTIHDEKLAFMKAFMGHPAVRMWNFYDEVYGYWERGDRPKKESDMGVTYRAARQLNPYQLHWNNSTFGGKLYGGAESTDITSATIYTIQGTGGAQGSVSAGETLFKVGGKLGGKPGMAGIWLQFYSGHGEVSELCREPSAEEMERMMYGCALKGVRAFWFFSMRPRSNRLFFRTGELSREMDALAPVFAFGRQLPSKASHGDVETQAYECEGKVYVITSNSATYDATSRINLPAACKKGVAKVLFEDREVAYKGWTLEDNWNKLSRHVYVIEPVR